MSILPTINSEDIQRLLKESADIVRSGDTYAQFRQNREAVLAHLRLVESKN